MLDKREGKCGRVYALGTTVFIICGEYSDAIERARARARAAITVRMTQKKPTSSTRTGLNGRGMCGGRSSKQPNDHEMIGLKSTRGENPFP
jgi:hypothetical protein